MYTFKLRKRVSSSIYQIYNYLMNDIVYLVLFHHHTDNLKTWKASWKRMSRDCWKLAQSLSDCNGTQNLAKWLSVHLRIRGCGFEFRCCHTINLKKYLDPRLGSSFGPLSIIFSVFSQKIWCCCHKQKKKILLKHLLGLAFFMFMKYCFVDFG